MIIGESKRFAIEFQVSEPHDWLLDGRLCYLVGGARVGDFEIISSLNIALAQFRQIVKLSGNRYDHSLYEKPAAEAFSEIYNALHDDDSRSNSQIDEDNIVYGRFRADISLYSFDYWPCFVVEADEAARFLWICLNDPSKEVHAQKLVSSEFDDVVKRFIDYMSAHYSAELGDRRNI